MSANAPDGGDVPASDGPAATAARGLERLGVHHTHDPGTTSVIFVLAVVLGNYAAWLVADVGIGLPVFAIGSLVATWGLYRQPTRRAVAVRTLQALAALLIATPIAIDLTFLVLAGRHGVTDPLSFVTTPADLVFLVAFAIPAAALLVVAWRLDRSGADDAAGQTGVDD